MSKSNPFFEPIPVEKSAAFFLKLKTAGRRAPLDALHEALLKKQAEEAKEAVSSKWVNDRVSSAVKKGIPQGRGNEFIQKMVGHDLTQGAKLHAGAAVTSGSSQRDAVRNSASNLMAKISEEQASDEIDEASSMSAPGSPKADPVQEYLQNEYMGRKAEEQVSTDYYVQQLRQKAQELQAAQGQLGELSEQHEMAQQQLSGADGQMQASQQEGQMAQQAALSNVQSAGAQATTAMQQTIDAENRVIQAKAEAVQRTQQLQQFSQQLLDIAQAAAGAAAPIASSVDQAAAGLDPNAGAVMQDSGQPTDASMQPQEDPSVAAAGQVPGMEGQPGAEAPAGAPPPGGEGGAAPSASGAPERPPGGEDGEKKDDKGVSIKVGSQKINPQFLRALQAVG